VRSFPTHERFWEGITRSKSFGILYNGKAARMTKILGSHPKGMQNAQEKVECSHRESPEMPEPRGVE